MNQVGTVYGQGLYSLAKEEALEEEILRQLDALKTAFEAEPSFLKLLSSANLSRQERLALADESFSGKVHCYVLNFLKLLTEKGYIAKFPQCVSAYEAQYNLDRGILQVRAVSAVALTDSQKDKLSDKLSAITGKEIRLVCKVDPSVLGGVRLSYNGVQVDGTVQSRLQAMEKRLKNTVL